MNTVFILLWVAFSQAFRTVAGNKNQEYSGSQFIENRKLLRISIYWLNELEETYKIGFPKQFGSVNQNIRLIDHYGYDYVLNLAINEMVENPRARLFEFGDHSGDTENYHFTRSEREGFCSEIPTLDEWNDLLLSYMEASNMVELSTDIRKTSHAIHLTFKLFPHTNTKVLPR
ncbi:unnamed protein product [Allacma fusca]|uniref:Uncharacterized protein n=1 Tax=Allacma fusca TaxID=39272 RepID=A0A8J2L5G1_9HEXA|nr:unnamed protein product [Allacma fusca]